MERGAGKGAAGGGGGRRADSAQRSLGSAAVRTRRPRSPPAARGLRTSHFTRIALARTLLPRSAPHRSHPHGTCDRPRPHPHTMPRDALSVTGAAAWTRRWWRALLGEVVATALLVLLGVGSLVHRHRDGVPPPPLTHPALAFAFVVTALVQAFGGVSGAHMNPSVTLAAVLHGALHVAPAAAYVLAQFLGAILGFAALGAIAPAAALPVGVTAPATGVTPIAAACVEAALTGVLALACCGIWAAHDAARPDHAAPTKLGLTIGGLVYAGGELTGASLNPARSFAPALLQGQWEHHWVYWVGPLGGAALCTLLHRYVLTAPLPAAPRDPTREELPLHDKPDH